MKAEDFGRSLPQGIGINLLVPEIGPMEAFCRDVLGANVEPIYGPPRAGDVRDSQADIGKARSLLGYGVVAGLFYLIAGITIGLTRDGFDFGRHPLSLLMLGDDVGMIEVQSNDPDKINEILAPLEPVVRGRGVIVDWKQMNSALFEALEVERIAMFVVLCIIILVAAFNIASSLIMLVRAKTRDIAILRTMGASRRSLLKIFMTVGLSIGMIGIIIGAILGSIFLFFRQQVVNFIQLVTGQNLWDPSVRFLTELPSRTDPFEVAAIVGVTLVLTYVATLFPARNAANTDPVQVLRYE